MASKYDNILNKIEERPPRGENDHLLIIDSMNTLIRSFSMLKTMTPQGHHIGGLVGFLRSLGYLVRTFDPTKVICVFDGLGGSMNRKNINPEYKAQREHTKITNWGLYDTKKEESESITAQLNRLIDYLECLPVHMIMMDKLEADDIISVIAINASRYGKKSTIVSSDKDFLQIIDPNIEVYAPVKKKVFTRDNIEAELKMPPSNYLIAKALLGDNSDNLSGVKGLGIKTLLKEFPLIVERPGMTLEYIYDVCEQNIEGKKIFAKIIYDWDKVKTNYELMNIQETTLDDRELDIILDVLKEPAPRLQTGTFLHYLDNDKIEGITKNTEAWLETFRGLTGFRAREL